MNLEQALAEFQAAGRDYTTARNSLAHHRGLAKFGIANSLALAVAAEHSAFYRLERAQAAYAALQPAPKPVVVRAAAAPAPKTIAKPAPPATRTPAVSNTGSFDLLGHLNAQCKESEARWMTRYGLQPRRNT